MSVTFEARDGMYHAHLSHGKTERAVAAPVCADAAYALAVIAAIELDPNVAIEATAADASDFTESGAVPAAGETTAEPPAANPKRGKRATPGRPLPSNTAVESAGSTESTWLLFAGPKFTRGDISDVGFGGDLTALLVGSSQWSTLGVGVRVVSTARELELTTARFTRAGVGLLWCPGTTNFGRATFGVAVCVGAEGGWALVSTHDTSSFQRAQNFGRFNATATADLLLRLALGSHWHLGVRPGVDVSLVRNEYVIEASPGVTVTSVRHAPVTMSGVLQVGHAFH